MKNLISLLVCFTILITPGFANPIHEYDELPQEVLDQGLQASAVCQTINEYGIKRMISFYNDNKNDSTTISSEAGRAALMAGTFYENFLIEKIILQRIVMAFKEHYKLSFEDIANKVGDTLEVTEQSMHDKYDKINTYDEFTSTFQQSLTSCSSALETFRKSVDSEIKKLDNKAQ